ncbi:MAG TPA: peptide chain release factor N(5)-glutamine methyltransferase [Solirubrobacteraceae bacterium]|nr:peptide chain release factor N(5)-glutamine methyltransferase [Solirubrobacteraceae bacterium]
MSLHAAVSARDALDGARTAIAAGGSGSARLDAELLLADALGVTRERVLIDRELVVSGAAVRRFQSHVRRRAVDREPVAYIVGRRAFRGLELTVDARVLIPRPETELLVEVGYELGHAERVLDCCTGAGAVALALKDERGDLSVTGSDVSDAALAVARANGERLGLDVAWRRGDLLDGLGGGFDAILANPPYIPTSVIATLEPEVSRHEPGLALDGGDDGLAVIRALATQAARTEVRLLAIEHGGDGQAEAVARLCEEAGFSSVERRRDLAGHERVIVARRAS